MSSSLPDGVTRRALGRADATLVAALLDADEVFLGGRSRLAADDVTDWWLRVELADDSWLFERDGQAVALGWLEDNGEVGVATGTVHPHAKGRGLGSHLVDVSEEHARGKGHRILRQFAPANDPAARELLEARGYRDVRHFYELAIELDEEPPPPELPAGLAIETFRTEDARAWHAASHEAFEDEWSFSPLPFERWWELRSRAEDFDPTLWFLVRDGDEIAAFARCDAGRRGGGFVGMLGVRKPWRRRGLGLALLRYVFREFRARGAERVSLAVDSENPTGATRLYERAGMQVAAEYVNFERPLA
jgi:mycothiol synthase